MFMLGFAPLLIPLAIYNIIAFPMSSVTWNAVVSTVRMPSGPDWTMSADDMLVAWAIVLLYGEVMNLSRVGIRTVVDHAWILILSPACCSSSSSSRRCDRDLFLAADGEFHRCA